MTNGTRRLSVVFAGVSAALVGCAAPRSEPVTLLRTEDFIAGSAGSPARARSADQSAPAVMRPQGKLLVSTPDEASDDVGDVELVVGEPAWVGRDASPAGKPLLIDAKIGEINGRPVRVEEIFRHGQLEERLIAEARQPGMTRPRWLTEVESLVRLQLDSLLTDELLRAEALASLRPEQRMGLRYFVQEMSENMRRQAGGSRAEAERRLREQHGQSMHQMEREREASILVLHQLEETTRKRIRVSWKDVRLYYERNFETFNPPARARVRVIRVSADDTEAIARVQEALESGTPFPEVAAMPLNTNAPDRGGLLPEVEFRGQFREARLALHETLAAAARQLKPGEWTREPVDFARARGGSDKAWVYLESIEKRTRPLSDRDVQREIADRLTRAAENAELHRYIESLKERASFTDIDDMTRRLVQIAADRYWPRD
jgi:hypothetical protein